MNNLSPEQETSAQRLNAVVTPPALQAFRQLWAEAKDDSRQEYELAIIDRAIELSGGGPDAS